MLRRSFRFGDLDSGEFFNYHGQMYKKESDAFAELLRWPSGEELDEYVSHYFEPQIVVIPIGSDIGPSDDTNTCRNHVNV